MLATPWLKISQPFTNLSAKERALLVLRLVATGCTLFLTLVVLIGPLITTRMYIGRINCAHLDVSYGLYKSLRNSVSSSPSILDSVDNPRYPTDTTLTNSEISILTEYAQAQVANAPQYILTSLWSWCFGNYNVTDYEDGHGNKKYKMHNQVLLCSKSNNRFVFDYRQELEQVGLKSILAYALHSNDEDSEYKNVIRSRDLKYKLVPPALIFCGASQFILIVCTIITYGNREGANDLSKLPGVLLHSLGLIAVASFASITIGAGIITRLLIDIRSEIKSSLGSFGVSLHLGKTWFLLLWAVQVFSTLALLSWAAPLWCANPDHDDEEDYEENYYPNRKTYIHGKHRKHNKIPQYRDYTPFKDLESEMITETTDEKPSSSLGKMKESLHNKSKRFSGFRSKKEEELRKLGETLSKKSSVRRTKSKTSKVKVEPFIIEEKEAKNILYQDNDKYLYPRRQLLNHYREETYDGYTNTHGLPTGVNSHEQKQSRRLPSGSSGEQADKRDSFDHSILDTEEIEFLNTNNFMNKL
ncbi:uncharacterized protein CANTADRAFT_54786 [Suhomyces tanzawaensis NRRL Y-17324]|uniref:Uncharacterized protein n=1 Tax=Suhomyces tanzawaensis NRRL Y-17324 TaxID=984487 RepID=A0A1E4SDW1_9ASCO|nr:uncharacterized protein CANTADRAFT_54786 [Suhomyces tanzawaensis NRRL Y-17324]ODV77704.1 hypothetical protein CANTADRAFT_54786 [Suhomyces tanzawaensis NRRL Y-17324]